MSAHNTPKNYEELHALFLSAKNAKEAKLLLEDLFTRKERDNLLERLHLVQELIKGTPQREISKKLGISISKITRGSRALQEGGEGFSLVLKPIKGKRGTGKAHN